MKIKKTTYPVLFLAVFNTVVTTFTTFPTIVLAQEDVVTTLREFDSFLDGGPDITRREPGENSDGSRGNGNDLDDTGSDNKTYEEFQECLSTAQAQKGKGFPTQEEVRDCFESSYTGLNNTKSTTENLDYNDKRTR